MAGSGKGPLRTAIEDFLETTHIWGFWKDKIVKVGEAVESVEAAYYSGFREAIQNAPGIPQAVKNILPLASGRGHQGGIFSAFGFAGALGGSAASALFAPYGKLLNYEIDKTAKSYRLDAQLAIAGFWRDPSKEAIYADDLNCLGWTKERVEVVTKLMHPRPNQGEMMTLVLRQKMTPTEFVTEMKARGFLEADAVQLMELMHVIPPVNDLISMAVREAWDDSTSARFEYDAEFPAPVLEAAKKQGLDEEWVRRYWRAHWQLPSPTMMYEMLHRLRPGTTTTPFTIEDARVLLKAADYPRFWRDRMIAISYSPYTRVDTRRMFKLGVLDEAGVKGTYLDLGYDEVHAQALTDFTKKYETTSGGSIKDELSDLTLSLLQEAYLKGALAEAPFREALAGMKYAGEVIDLIVNVTELRRVVSKAPDTTNEFQTKVKNMVISAYSSRLISEGEGLDMLSSVGYGSEDAAAILAIATYDYEFQVTADKIKNIGERFTGNLIDRSQAVTELGALNLSGLEQAQVMDEWDYAISHNYKRLTEAQYRAAWKKSIIDQNGYTTALQGLGYSDYDINLLVMLYATEGT